MQREEIRSAFRAQGLRPVLQAVVGDTELNNFRLGGTVEEEWAALEPLVVTMVAAEILVPPQMWLLAGCELLAGVTSLLGSEAGVMRPTIDAIQSQALGLVAVPDHAAQREGQLAMMARLGFERSQLAVAVAAALLIANASSDQVYYAEVFTLPERRRWVYVLFRALAGLELLTGRWSRNGSLNYSGVVSFARDIHAALAWRYHYVDGVPIWDASLRANSELVEVLKRAIPADSLSQEMVFSKSGGQA